MRIPRRAIHQAQAMHEALRTYHWPHYVQPVTRTRVISAYRQLLREIGKLDDTLVRDLLHKRTLHHFTRFKYVSDPGKINALCDLADNDIHRLQLALQGDHKSLKSILDLAFRNFGVRESPVRVLAPSWHEYSHDSLVYRLNNIHVPEVKTFEQHIALREAASFDFNTRENDLWLLVNILRRSGVKSGKNGRKLVVDPLSTPLTPGGFPIPWSRQKNLLRRTYAVFLRDSPRPVHPMILKHIKSQLTNRDIPRKMKRRLQECARSYFSVIGTPDKFEVLQLDLLNLTISGN